MLMLAYNENLMRTEFRDMDNRRILAFSAACCERFVPNLNVAETSGGQGIFDGLESLPNHRIVADIEYLAAIRPDQQAGAID